MNGSVERHQLALSAASHQAGVISHHQLVTILGWPRNAVASQLKAHRWQRVFDGVYAVTTGDLPIESLWWAAHLCRGPASALCATSALQAWGARRREPPIELAVPIQASARTPGLVIHRHRQPLASRSPRGLPPAVVLPLAIVTQSNRMDPADVLDQISSACQQGKVSPDQIERAMRGRRVRHRGLIRELLCEIGGGATTPLEIAGVRRILKAHGLPTGQGQVRERTNGRTVIRDRVVHGLIIEFDGRLGHANATGRFRDLDRDNAATLTGRPTLRFGWTDVNERPCRAADQVAAALELMGQTVPVRRCGDHCDSERAS